MVVPTNEPDAPPSSGKKSQTRAVWIALIVLALAIIAGFVVVGRQPGAEMGGSLATNGGSTRSDADRAP